jgi:ceramide glucosyltransferase
VTALIGILAVTSFGLAIWQFVVGWRFPLHRRLPTPDDRPGLTLLKPVKGCDGQTEACLRSWFEQRYAGPVQILLGVASMDDPAVPLIRRLIDSYPAHAAELVHCARDLGTNAKVSILIQLHERSQHQFVCVSDADVLAPADFLEQSVALLAGPGVGLVNSFYQVSPSSASRLSWEALAINADFWSQVLQSASFRPVNFALGAAMVFRRDPFDQAGGFRPLADHLADDYHLGHRIAEAGWTIELLPVVVECRADPTSFVAVWKHQLRWARTIRACQPWPYFFSILSNATLWPLLWWAAVPSRPIALATVVMLGWRSLHALLLERRLTRCWNPASAGVAWLKDILQVGLWALAYAGTTVSWRGIRYSVDKNGKLTRLGLAQ